MCAMVDTVVELDLGIELYESACVFDPNSDHTNVDDAYPYTVLVCSPSLEL